MYHFVRGRLPHAIQALHQEYGEVVRTAPDTLSFISPSAQTDIHTPTRARYLQKDMKMYPIRHPTVHSILTCSDADHARHRKAWSPAFSERALREQQPLFDTYLDQLVGLLDQACASHDPTVDFVEAYNWTTFDLVGHLVFGAPFGCLSSSAYHPWVAIIFDNIKAGSLLQAVKYYPWVFQVLKRLIPTSLLRKRAAHDAFTHERVAARLDGGSDMPDFFSYVLDRNEKAGLLLSQLEMELDAATILIAGSETTATTLSAITYFLCRNPAVMERVTREVRGAFADEAAITGIAVGKLPYLTACIEEGMRLLPAIPFGLARRVENCDGVRISGHWVPVGVGFPPSQKQCFRLRSDVMTYATY